MATTPRPALSRDRILDAAAEVLAEANASSAPSLTMRRLAERLDVTPMAIYRWFDDKDALLDAMAARIALPTADLPDGPDTEESAEPGAPWEERGLRWATDMRRALLAHLPLLRLDGASRRLAHQVFARADTGLQLVATLGYEGPAAVEAYRVLFWSVLEFCLVIDAGDALPADPRSAAQTSPDALTGGTDLAELDGDLPALVAHLPLFTPLDAETFFTVSIGTVLAGLAARAPTS